MAKELKSAHNFPFANSVPLQVARPTGNRVHGTTGAASARVTLPTGATIVRVTAEALCYVKFGGVSVDAAADVTSMLFPAGVEVIPVPVDGGDVAYTHMAFIQHTDAGIVQVEEVD